MREKSSEDGFSLLVSLEMKCIESYQKPPVITRISGCHQVRRDRVRASHMGVGGGGVGTISSSLTRHHKARNLVEIWVVLRGEPSGPLIMK